MKPLSLAALLCLVAAPAAAGERVPPINVTVSATEWAGVARPAAPATGGVPIAPGLLRSAQGLALVDEKGQAVPAQFAPLVTDRDGFIRWLLVDCQVDLEAGQSKTFTLKPGKNPPPKEALEVQSSGDLVEVTTGPMRFSVNRRHYNFLDTVWIDANGNRRFDKPERIVIPATAANIAVVDAETGIQYTSLGAAPKTPRFEYKGPLKAVLVIDGQLTDEQGKTFLGYRTRITAFAGQSLLLVEHSLRNSRKEAVFNARIGKAELALGLADDVTQYHLGSEAGKTTDGTLLEGDEAVVLQGPPDQGETRGAFVMSLSGKKGRKQLSQGREVPGWAFASSAARGVFLFDRDFAPAAPKRMVQRWGRLAHEDVPDGRPLVLPDLTCRVTRLALDFAARSADRIEPVPLMARVRAPLMLLVDPAYLARSGALGGPFASVDDETKVYRGVWKWTQDAKRRPEVSPDPAVYVRGADLQIRPEGDILADSALEVVRTHLPAFFYQAAARARHNAYEAAWRTDGFDFRPPGPRRKPLAAAPGPDVGKFAGDYNCAGGLADWYCLTGDAEALEAAIDETERAAATWKPLEPGQAPGPAPATPGFNSMLEGLGRVFQVTYDPRWLDAVKRMEAIAVQSPWKDERGCFNLPKEAPAAGSVPTVRPFNFELHLADELSRSVWAAYSLTANEDARDLVCGLGYAVAKFGDKEIWVWHTDTLARAYDLTGDAALLPAAKDAWARGSKSVQGLAGNLGEPGTEVGRMLQDAAAAGGGTNDAWARLFFWYVAHPREDAQPPTTVKDLAVIPGTGETSAYLTWTAPDDQGKPAAVYQAKEATLPIVEYQDFDYAKDQGKKRNWWFAANLAGEPTPAKPGAKERFLVKDLKPGLHYFALKSRDAAGNESAVSNVVQVEISGAASEPK